MGLDFDVSPTQVKRKFKDLAIKFHPDRNPGNFLAEEKFKLLQRAFKIVLADAKYRDKRNSKLIRSTQSETMNLPMVCRRRKRATRSDRKFGWELKEDYIGTNVWVKA